LFEAMHQEPLGPQLLGKPLAKYLEEEQRLGRVSPNVDPRAVAWLLLGPMAMLALASQMGRAQASIDLPEQLRQMVAALITGLRPD
ncbi:MAG: hypothetical protein ACXWM8_07205, partial [Candidatus Limnocylindrales bacterium]